MHAKLLQSCPTLCNPMDRSPSGSSVHGNLQARMLEWVVISSFRGSSNPRIDPTFRVSCIGRQAYYHWSHLGSPSSSNSKCQIHSLHLVKPFHPICVTGNAALAGGKLANSSNTLGMHSSVLGVTEGRTSGQGLAELSLQLER